MATQLLMPKATAVWLVDNTALSFDQIAAFCKLHPLEVKAIADGEASQGIRVWTRSLRVRFRAKRSRKAKRIHIIA